MVGENNLMPKRFAGPAVPTLIPAATTPITFAEYDTNMQTRSLPNSDNTALYKLVERHISNAVIEGRLSPGERLQSPEILAKSWGLGASTVRQALQILAARGVVVRRPKIGTFVNPDFDPATALRDTETPSARTSTARRSCLAVIVPDLLKWDYASVLRGAELAAETSNVSILIGNTENNPTRLNQVVRQHLNEGVAGLIIVSGKQMSLNFDLVQEIQRSSVGVVACYRPIGMVDWPFIRADTLYNTHLMVQHLCAIGRKHIALYDFATQSEIELHVKRDGRLGFLSALTEAGLRPDPDLHLETPHAAFPQGQSFYVISPNDVDPVAYWLEARPHVDAVVCVSDRLAAVVVAAARKIGRNVPDDLAVAGFGNYGRLFGLGDQWLTSVDVKLSEVGRQACDLILGMQAGKSIPPNTTIALKGTVSIGGSTVRGGSTPNDPEPVAT